ncbi:hypothetical protein BS17DRAFT_782769 [Gyrodon lividus]|nr:hypothetical protein BS17DRAFT_782769 [Gyrodon lividus]
MLSSEFREFGSATAPSFLRAANAGVKKWKWGEGDSSNSSQGTCSSSLQLTHFTTYTYRIRTLSLLVTPFDLKRFESYANNTVGHHVILDFLPKIAPPYFEKRLVDEVNFSVLRIDSLGMGLQRKVN